MAAGGGVGWARTALLATAIVFCGTVVAASAKFIGTRIPAWEQVLIRSALCILASPLLGGSGFQALRRSQNRRWLFVRGCCGFLGCMCYAAAVQKLSLLSVSLVTRMHPLVGPALVRVLSCERATPQQVVGYIIGVIGLTVGSPEDTWRATSEASYGFNYSMAATLATGISFYCVHRLSRKGEDPAAVRAAFHASCVFCSLGFGYADPKRLAKAALPSLPEMGALAVGAAAVTGSQLGLWRLFEAGELAHAVPGLLLSAVFSAAFDMLLGAGAPSWKELQGAALVFAAVGLSSLGAGYPDPEEPAKKEE